jgi:hypothetical protein
MYISFKILPGAKNELCSKKPNFKLVQPVSLLSSPFSQIKIVTKIYQKMLETSDPKATENML